uniref:Uncharacterized protein n=1 Tax=Schistosoma mansoni TaxID=6183 RepID=A0A5K4F611_SCHMA
MTEEFYIQIILKYNPSLCSFDNLYSQRINEPMECMYLFEALENSLINREQNENTIFIQPRMIQEQ